MVADLAERHICETQVVDQVILLNRLLRELASARYPQDPGIEWSIAPCQAIITLTAYTRTSMWIMKTCTLAITHPWLSLHPACRVRSCLSPRRFRIPA